MPIPAVQTEAIDYLFTVYQGRGSYLRAARIVHYRWRAANQLILYKNSNIFSTILPQL